MYAKNSLVFLLFLKNPTIYGGAGNSKRPGNARHFYYLTGGVAGWKAANPLIAPSLPNPPLSPPFTEGGGGKRRKVLVY